MNVEHGFAVLCANCAHQTARGCSNSRAQFEGDKSIDSCTGFYFLALKRSQSIAAYSLDDGEHSTLHLNGLALTCSSVYACDADEIVICGVKLHKRSSDALILRAAERLNVKLDAEYIDGVVLAIKDVLERLVTKVKGKLHLKGALASIVYNESGAVISSQTFQVGECIEDVVYQLAGASSVEFTLSRDVKLIYNSSTSKSIGEFRPELELAVRKYFY